VPKQVLVLSIAELLERHGKEIERLKRAKAKKHTKNTPSKRRPKFSAIFRKKLWENSYGKTTEGICTVCSVSTISVFTFVVGHDVAWSAGGSNDMSNTRPICAHCNSSMGTKTFKQVAQEVSDTSIPGVPTVPKVLSTAPEHNPTTILKGHFTSELLRRSVRVGGV
jgi:5-methylcytosine-specific restriction endonuclease McrA